MRRILILAALALTAAACGARTSPGAGTGPTSQVTGPTSQVTGPTSQVTGPTSPITGPTSPITGPTSEGDAAGTLVVTEEIDPSGGLYVEGSLSYIRVSDGEDVVFQWQMPDDGRLQHDLPPGTYTLTSFQRPCDGNCGYLDPPTDRCSEPLTVEAGVVEQVHVTVRPGSGCEFGSDTGTSPA